MTPRLRCALHGTELSRLTGGPSTLAPASEPGGGHTDGGASRATFAYLRPLDGLRGVAVAAVVIYHLYPGVLPGGFLGVDMFFVLSGFLIASLVVGEHQATGGVGLRNFYLRRLRRLTPAVLVLMVALGTYAAVAGTPAELARLRVHGLWSLAWMANWRFIFDGTTYTDVVAGVSPLRHMWSLAIEEQFYLVFPLLVLLLGLPLLGGGRNLRRRLVAVAAVGAVASAVWMVVVFRTTDGIERAYYGTDTRVQGLLVGVVLGAVLLGRPPSQGRAAQVLSYLAAPAVIAVAVLFVVAGEQSQWMYHGGFLAVAVVVAVVISAVAASGWLAASLSWRPLVLLGMISYGVYLWHWPVIVLLNGQRLGMTGLGLAAVQVAVTLGCATLSFVAIERPVRNGALRRHFGRWATLATPVGVAVAVVVLVAGTTVPEVPTVEPRASASTGQPQPDTPPPDAVASNDALPSNDALAAPLPMVIMGDSVAHTLAGGALNLGSDDHPAWEPELSQFDPELVTMVSIAQPRCSYLPGRLVSRAGGRVTESDPAADCGDWQTQLNDTLDATGARVVVLVSALDTLDRSVDGELIGVGSPQWTALYERFLTDLSLTVAGSGARLVLVTPPQRTGRFFIEEDNETGWREDTVSAALQAFAQRNPLVTVLDLASVVCPGGDCSSPAEGFDPDWRFDGLHYDGFGSRWFADWGTPRLLAADPIS